MARPPMPGRFHLAGAFAAAHLLRAQRSLATPTARATPPGAGDPGVPPRARAIAGFAHQTDREQGPKASGILRSPMRSSHLLSTARRSRAAAAAGSAHHWLRTAIGSVKA